MEKIIALLPMKGHSERVKNKNLKLFAGKPLYHAIANTLLASKYIEQIVVNTDGEHIAEDIEKNFPEIKVNWRPEEVRGDFVSMNKVLATDLSIFPEQKYFLQTHSTNPNLKTETVNLAIENYFEKLDQHDSLFSVTRWQTRLYWKNGDSINHSPRELLRTQDLPPVFEENSNLYIFSREMFLHTERRIGESPQMFEIDRLEAWDIDTPEDFTIAELISKL